MRLVDDWRRILRHAWTVRLGILAAALNGLAAVSYLLSTWFDPLVVVLVSPMLYVAAFAASLMVPAARIIRQKAISDANK